MDVGIGVLVGQHPAQSSVTAMGFSGLTPAGTVAGSIVQSGLQGTLSGQFGSTASGSVGVTQLTGMAAWPEVEHVAASVTTGSGQSGSQAQELSK
jgi:hypothetical protein